MPSAANRKGDGFARGSTHRPSETPAVPCGRCRCRPESSLSSFHGITDMELATFKQMAHGFTGISPINSPRQRFIRDHVRAEAFGVTSFRFERVRARTETKAVNPTRPNKLGRQIKPSAIHQFELFFLSDLSSKSQGSTLSASANRSNTFILAETETRSIAPM